MPPILPALARGRGDTNIGALHVSLAKLPAMRPYDLRHSFASLLIAEGRSIVEVAEQLGHAPTMSLDTYGHVFAEFDPRQRRSAEDLTAEARENVRAMYARASGEEIAGALNPA
jgi:integrase